MVIPFCVKTMVGVVKHTLHPLIVGGVKDKFHPLQGYIHIYIIIVDIMRLLSCHFFLSSRSFFQSVCTLGYCLLPLALSLLLSRIILTIFVSRPMLSLVLRAGFIVAAVIWSTKGEKIVRLL